MGSILNTLAIIMVLSFAWTVYKNERRVSEQPGRQVVTIQDMEQAAAKVNVEMNRGLPTMVDSQTMLTKVEATTSVTIYHIKMVNYPAAYLDQDFLIKAQETIGRRNCADNDIRWSFDQGIHMKYIVSGSDNRQAGSFLISKVYCQRFR